MSSIARDVRHGRLIARVEFRRTVRAILANDSRLVSLVAFAVLSVPFGLFWLYGSYTLGASVGFGPAVAPTIGSFVVPAVLAVAATVAVGTVQDGPFPDRPTLPLSAASARAVVLAKLFSTVSGVGALVVGPTLLVGGAFLAGAGKPLAAPAVALWLLPVVVCGAPLGYLAGIWLTRLDRRLPVPAGAKAAVWLGFLFGSVVVGQHLGLEVAGNGRGAAFDLLPAFGPTTAYASLLFPGETAGGSSLLGGAVAVGLVGIGVVAAGRSIGAATALWFADRPVDDDARTRRPSRPPAPFSWTKSGRIGWHYLRLASRGPRRLAHLLFLSFLLFPLVAPLADAGLDALRFAPAAGVLACVLLAGATFCLNPLGDERGTLPLVLLSGTDAGAFVRGRIVAGLVPGSGVLVLAGVVGAAAGIPPSSAGWLAALGLGLSVPAGAVAAGLGVLVPKYDAEEVFGVETVRPSNVPFFAFQFGALAVGAAGLLLVGAPDPALETIRSRWSFLLAYAAVVAASGALCYLIAVRRLRAKTLER